MSDSGATSRSVQCTESGADWVMLDGRRLEIVRRDDGRIDALIVGGDVFVRAASERGQKVKPPDLLTVGTSALLGFGAGVTLLLAALMFWLAARASASTSWAAILLAMLGSAGVAIVAAFVVSVWRLFVAGVRAELARTRGS